MTAKYLSVAEMVAVEQAADAAGFTYAHMMENAGANLAQAILDAYSQIGQRTALGLVGKGNNGGDTLVALERLARSGWNVAAYIVGEREPEDPLVERMLKEGGVVRYFSDDESFTILKAAITGQSILLDGLLGTGIELPLREPVPSVLAAVREILAGQPQFPRIVAVDCPSGVDCDTGAAADECLPAERTVCMAAVKRGLLAFPAYEYVGELQMVGIGLPPGFEPLESHKRFVVDGEFVRAVLPHRPLDGHKGTFGKALIVGGSRDYTGAALLAGKSAFRSGAGWVTIGLPQSLQMHLVGHFLEATWLPLYDVKGRLVLESATQILENLERVTALLVGPGVGLNEDTEGFIQSLLSYGAQLPPSVFDADGLKLLVGDPAWAAKLPPETILTPHPGEMAGLTGLETVEIQADRISTAERYAVDWGHVVVLKGAFTIIASPDGRTAVIPVATPALGRAGTGDVLAGMITGLRAQGIPAFEAAAAGAWLHARCGLAAAESHGNTATVLAGDLIEQLPVVFASLHQK